MNYMNQEIRHIGIALVLKRTFMVLGVLLLTVQNVLAQQQNLNGHYYFNPYAINNAWAGYEGRVDASLTYRQNWVGFDNAPNSFIGTVHIPLNVYMPKSYPMPILGLALEDTLNKLKTEKVRNDDYGNFAEGGGLSIASHSQGNLSLNSLMLSYAMHSIPKKPYANSYSLGFGLGLTNFRTNLANVHFSDPETALAENSFSFIKPNLELGILYSISKWAFMRNGYVGYSVKQGFNNSIGFGLGNNGASLRLHHYLSAGRVMLLNEQFQLLATALYRMVEATPNILEVNAQLVYYGIINAGIGGRSNGDIVFNAGFMIGGALAFNYSYDVVQSNKKNFGASSHQVSIGYSFDR